MKAKQLTLDDAQMEGPKIGEDIEYNPYTMLGCTRWYHAVVVAKWESPGWPDLKRGYNAKRTRIAMEVAWHDHGRTQKGGCFVDHEGRTWRHPGSDQVHPDPY